MLAPWSACAEGHGPASLLRSSNITEYGGVFVFHFLGQKSLHMTAGPQQALLQEAGHKRKAKATAIRKSTTASGVEHQISCDLGSQKRQALHRTASNIESGQPRSPDTLPQGSPCCRSPALPAKCSNPTT